MRAHRGGRRRDHGVVTVDRRHGSHRVREGGRVRRPVDPRAGRHRRRERAARAGRAPVRHHRAVHARGAPQPADAARPRSAHLLQGGGRRPGDGRLRAEPDPVGGERHPPAVPVPAARQRLGPLRPDHGAGHRPRAASWPTPASARSSTAPRASPPTATSSSARRPSCRNFFVGAGFNAFGIAAGGGAGQALAEWVHDGVPPYDLWVVDLRRFGRPHQRHRLGAHPHARGVRQALHDGLAVRGAPQRPARAAPRRCTTGCATQGACFGEKLGWERPNWFADARARRDRRATSTPTAARTGSPPSAASTERAARRPCWSTRRRSPSSR